jgi:hypothetical protein
MAIDAMRSSLPDAGQCDTENTGQWTLLPSHEQAQHLTESSPAAMKRSGIAVRCSALFDDHISKIEVIF